MRYGFQIAHIRRFSHCLAISPMKNKEEDGSSNCVNLTDIRIDEGQQNDEHKRNNKLHFLGYLNLLAHRKRHTHSHKWPLAIIQFK